MAHLELIRSRPTLTWRERLREQLRSFTLGPYNLKDPALARIFGGRSVSSGVAVSETTAMNYSAVWAAVNLIASHVASVPLPLYKRTDDGRGKERFSTHPLYRLIHDRPNVQMGSMVFRRTLQAHTLIWGNGYAEIERDSGDRPVALWPLLPYAVTPVVESGVLRYRVQNPTLPEVMLDARDMLHIRGLGDDGICGYSVIQKARESIGLGIAAERFGATFFGNGSTFGGVISYPAGINPTPQTRKENRDALEAQHQGVERAHRFLALYEGAKYERLGIPPNDAQFLETRQFQIEEICRWFNLPPHKLKHLERSTNNNIEHQGIEYVTDTLDPWWVIWEEELTMKLIAPLERGIQLIEHVREGLLRGDVASRGEFQSKQFSVAAVTPNEIRAMENRNPVSGGDRAFVAMNLIPLDRVDEWFSAQIEKAKTPPTPPAPPRNKDDDDGRAEQLVLARKAVQAAEDARDLALQLRDEAHAKVAETQASQQATQADLDSTRTTLRAVETRAGEALVARDAAVARVEVVESMLAAAIADVARLTTALDAEKAGRAQDAAMHDDESAREAAARLKTEADCVTALALAAQAEQERDAARVEAAAFQQTAEVSAEAVRQTKAEFDAVATVSHEVRNERDRLAAEAESLKTDLARARADLATELDAKRQQYGVRVTAMRGLFVDAIARVIQRESDRARKNQATPERLRTWLETFYPLHADVCRSTLRPVVAAWAVMTGTEADALLERLVTAHIEDSTTALRHVLESEDADALAANLERTVRRWETERADAVADAVIREGMAG